MTCVQVPFLLSLPLNRTSLVYARDSVASVQQAGASLIKAHTYLAYDRQH